jgi:hypothetical protein
MATICIWKGVRRVVLGDDIEFVEYETFIGEELGAVWEEENSRGTQTVFYHTEGGKIVVHQVLWSRWENEATYAYIHVFPALEGVNGAAAMFWRELRKAGLIPPRTVELGE